MSQIVIAVKDVPAERRREALTRLRAITGKSLGEISRCLTSGEPIMEVMLFQNDHEEVAGRLHQLLSEIPALGASLQLFELAAEQEFMLPMDQNEISVEILQNILKSSEERRRHRQEMWDKYGHV